MCAYGANKNEMSTNNFRIRSHGIKRCHSYVENKIVEDKFNLDDPHEITKTTYVGTALRLRRLLASVDCEACLPSPAYFHRPMWPNKANLISAAFDFNFTRDVRPRPPPGGGRAGAGRAAGFLVLVNLKAVPAGPNPS
ncbi:hypothetical protein EVAR_33883_1 [Eumeta japonica]|uniref:Uncharacterized protein n=1 Tax=Eumeta variegata TaxID=151549 RepID=A0A4C1WKW6_EUMVA|nr:hypothetical protein EVAR_33883_1 [Eumeta japonica]